MSDEPWKFFGNTALSIRPLGTNLSEIWIEILIFSFKKMRLQMLSAKIVAIMSRGRWSKTSLAICIDTILNSASCQFPAWNITRGTP